jgi:hypothetical protein
MNMWIKLTFTRQFFQSKSNWNWELVFPACFSTSWNYT